MFIIIVCVPRTGQGCERVDSYWHHQEMQVCKNKKILTNSSDVKRCQNLEAEAEAEANVLTEAEAEAETEAKALRSRPRPRPSRRGQIFEVEAKQRPRIKL